MAEIPQGDWEWIMGINLWGVIYGCRVFIPRFKAQGRGAILNVASAAGLLCTPEMAPYNVTKAGVVALSETLCSELKGDRIGVTVLCPTFFQTNIMQATRSQEREPSARRGEADGAGQGPGARGGSPRAASVDAGELYSLPHADGAWSWRIKRMSPERFYQTLVPRYFKKTMGRGR
jgi:NAD(P)-dependent dehydrogenase (short-subunit alcohol dehydrogenase family)